MPDDRGGLVDPVLAQHAQGIGEGGGVGHGRARADYGGVVPRHVRDQEAHEARRMAGRAQSPALDCGEMLAHGVDLADGGARAEQGAGDRLLVRQLDACRRQREQRRPAARDEAEREIVRAEGLRQSEDARRGRAATGVRHRMRRLDHLDRPRRHAVAVAGHDEAFEGARPMIFDRLRHARRRLAGAHDHGAARGRRGQMRRHVARRPGAGEGCVQQAAQERSGVFAHAAPCQSRSPTSSAPQARAGATGYHAGARTRVSARIG